MPVPGPPDPPRRRCVCGKPYPDNLSLGPCHPTPPPPRAPTLRELAQAVDLIEAGAGLRALALLTHYTCAQTRGCTEAAPCVIWRAILAWDESLSAHLIATGGT